MAGNGTLYQRKSNSKWYLVYNTGRKIVNKKGKEVYEQKWHDLETADKNIAKEKAKLVRADLARGKNIEPSKMMVGEIVSEWSEGNKTRISERTGKKLNRRTVEEYNKIIHNHIIPEVGATPIKKFGRKEVQTLIEKKNIESGFTARKIYVILKSSFDYVFKDDEWFINPCTKVTAPKQPKIKHKIWTADQALTFLEESKNNHPAFKYGIFLMSLHQGLRIGEVLGLPIENVNLIKGTALISQKLTRIEGKWIIEELVKTDSTCRTIILTPTVIEVLKQLIGNRTDGLVFLAEEGGFVRLENLRNRGFNSLIRLYNRKVDKEPYKLPKIRIHDMRHSAGTLLYKLFKDIKLVQLYLGHATISMAADTYIHEDDDMLREAAAAMDEALKKKPRFF
jgi:integrase